MAQLQEKLENRSLGELSEDQFEAYCQMIGYEMLVKPARHAVCENQHTLQALAELIQGNLAAFGDLMNQSHLSLRYNYEVTDKELDTLVEAAWEQEGVLGARMTGTGFGGCSIAIVNQANRLV